MKTGGTRFSVVPRQIEDCALWMAVINSRYGQVGQQAL